MTKIGAERKAGGAKLKVEKKILLGIFMPSNSMKTLIEASSKRKENKLHKHRNPGTSLKAKRTPWEFLNISDYS